MTEQITPLEQRDGPRDECGVFGIYAPDHDVARLAYFALYALQHRGQESAGHRRGRPRRLHHHPARARPGQPGLQGARPPRAGRRPRHRPRPLLDDGLQRVGELAARPPVRRLGRQRELALAHNGNLINAVELHAELRDQGVQFSSTSDSEIIAALISTHPAERLEDAVADVLPRLKGAFSTVVMSKDEVVAFRDPAGLRPLSVGQLERPLLRRLGVVRVRHHRRRAPARRAAGRDGHAVASRGSSRARSSAASARRSASSSTSTSRAPTRG